MLRLIPTSALAAILVYTGYKLVNIKAIKDLKKFGWGEVGIYAATVATIVVADLLTGVIVGITLAAAKLLYRFSRLDTELQIDAGNEKAVLRQGPRPSSGFPTWRQNWRKFRLGANCTSIFKISTT